MNSVSTARKDADRKRSITALSASVVVIGSVIFGVVVRLDSGLRDIFTAVFVTCVRFRMPEV